MTRNGNTRNVLAPRHAQGRRRARGLDRRPARVRLRRTRPATATAAGTKPPLTPDQLSSYLAVNADGTVSAYFGKMDMGQGLVGRHPADRGRRTRCAVRSRQNLHRRHRHQRQPGRRIRLDRRAGRRQADAHGRRRSAARAGRDGGRQARSSGRPAHGDGRRRPRRRRRCQESQLRRPHRRPVFQRPSRLERQIRQSALRARQGDSRRTPRTTRSSASRIKRDDIAPKVFAQTDFATDVKVPGMVHGRMIRPAVAGAVPVKVDESSIKNIPSAKVVWDKGFLGVVADKEWDAIKAAQQLKVEWSDAAPPFPDQAALYDHIRNAPTRKREVDGKQAGNVDDAFKSAARVIEAEYEWPFQSHACMGPACALVEIKDGHVTCWSGTQKSHFVRTGVAAILRRAARIPSGRSGRPGPGSYGRSDADDCAMDAAVPRQGGRQAGAAAIHARPGHRLGSQGAGLDPPRARRDRCIRQGRRLRLPEQGLLPRRRRHQRQQAEGHAGRTDARRRAQVRRRLRRAGGILRLRQQAHRLGNDRAAARPRLAAAHLAYARSGRAADPLRQRIVHRRSGGGARYSTRSNSGCAT